MHIKSFAYITSFAQSSKYPKTVELHTSPPGGAREGPHQIFNIYTTIILQTPRASTIPLVLPNQPTMPLAKIYLTAYNALNALLWSAVLYRTATTLGVSAGRFDFDAVYPSVGTFTKWTQSLIVLDVIHVLFGMFQFFLLI